MHPCNTKFEYKNRFLHCEPSSRVEDQSRFALVVTRATCTSKELAPNASDENIRNPVYRGAFLYINHFLVRYFAHIKKNFRSVVTFLCLFENFLGYVSILLVLVTNSQIFAFSLQNYRMKSVVCVIFAQL